MSDPGPKQSSTHLLGEIVDFLDHMRKPVQEKDRTRGNYPYYGANGQQGTIDNYIFDESLVLLAEDGGHFANPSRGVAYKISGKSWVNNHAHVLRPRNNVDIDFLYRILENRDVTRFITGTTRAKLTKSSATQIPVSLPPFQEQRRIAQVLDQVDALRAKRREAIALLDDLAQALFLDMFGDPVANPSKWDRIPMSDLLERIDSGKSPKCPDRPASSNEWGVLKLSSVTQCTYNPKENKALPANAKIDRKNEVRPGDLLFTRKNTPELVAASAYVQQTRSKLLIPDLIFRLVAKDTAPIDTTYLHSLITYPSKRKKLQELASGSSSSMSNISKSKLLRFECEVPPLALQQGFASRLKRIQAVKHVHQVHLAKLDDLFASVQYRAFRGELWDSPAA